MGRFGVWLGLALSIVAFGQDADRGAPDPVVTTASSQGLLSLVPIAPRMDEFQPISSADKLRFAFRSAVRPTTFALSAVTAGFNQAKDNHPQFGQGLSGYGKRFATSYADYAAGYVLAEGVFPAILHQDPRYFRQAGGGVASRIGHALAGSFVAYSDSGKRVLNSSMLLGNAAAVGVASAYYTDQRSPGVAARNWAIYVGYDMAWNLFKEFWPDIVRKLQRK